MKTFLAVLGVAFLLAITHFSGIYFGAVSAATEGCVHIENNTYQCNSQFKVLRGQK